METKQINEKEKETESEAREFSVGGLKMGNKFYWFALVFAIMFIAPVTAVTYSTPESVYANFELFYNSEAVYTQLDDVVIGDYYTGKIDEIGFYDNNLTYEQIQEIWNDGMGRELSKVDIIVLNPTKEFINYSSVDFNIEIESDEGINNVTIFIKEDEDLIYTNTDSSGRKGLYNWNKELEEKTYSWYIEVYTDEEKLITSKVRDLTIDLTLPQIESYLNESTLFYEGQEIEIINNIYDLYLDSCWYIYNDSEVIFNCSENINLTTTLDKTELIIYAKDLAGNLNNKELPIIIDPTITIIDNPVIMDLNQNHTVNFTVTDVNLDNVWLEYMEWMELDYDGTRINISKREMVTEGEYEVWIARNRPISTFGGEEGDSGGGKIIAYGGTLNVSCYPAEYVYNVINGCSMEGGIKGYIIAYNETNEYRIDIDTTGEVPRFGWGEKYPPVNPIISGEPNSFSFPIEREIENFTIYANNTVGNIGQLGGTLTFDDIAPNITIIDNPVIMDLNQNHTVNFTVTDVNLDENSVRLFYGNVIEFDSELKSYFDGNIQNVGDNLNTGTYYFNLTDDYNKLKIVKKNTTSGEINTNYYDIGNGIFKIKVSIKSAMGVESKSASIYEDDVLVYNFKLPHNEINPTIRVTEIGNNDETEISSEDEYYLGKLIPELNKSFFYIYAMDNTGNRNTLRGNLTYDELPPTITITEGDGLLNYGNLIEIENHTINFTVTDDNLNVSTIRFEYNNINASKQTILENLAQVTLSSSSWVKVKEFTNINDYIEKVEAELRTDNAAYTKAIRFDIIYVNGTTIQKEFTTTNTTYNLYEFVNPNLYENVSKIEIYGQEVSTTSEAGYIQNARVYKYGYIDEGTYYSVSFPIQNKTFNATIYAEDMVGNTAQKLVEWDYKVFENEIKYDKTVFESEKHTIIGNFTINPQPKSITLHYNGEIIIPNVISQDNNVYIASTSPLAPIVNETKNITNYFEFEVGNEKLNSTEFFQTIVDVELSTNCAGKFNVLNLTNYNEETLALMSAKNEYILNLIDGSGNIISKLSGNFTGQTISLCSSVNISELSSYYNLQVRYYADNYAYKTYNIESTKTTNLPISIPLYHLNEDKAFLFKIDYKDWKYFEHPEAILQIQRQYLEEDTYRTVEIPLIDSEGNARASFDTRNIKYKIVVVESGKILDIFNNVFPQCQSDLYEICQMDLRGSQEPETFLSEDFIYRIESDNDGYVLTYSIPSGKPASVSFETEQESVFIDSVSNCSKTIFGSSGTIKCGIDKTVGDSIVDIKVKKNDELMAYGSSRKAQEAQELFFTNNFFLAFILLLTLILMFVGNAVMMVISSVVGIFYLALVMLITSDSINILTGATSLAWLLLAAIILIYRISKKEDKT